MTVQFLETVPALDSTKDILGREDTGPRYLRFSVQSDDMRRNVALTMSASAEACMEGIDCDEWLKSHAAEIIEDETRRAHETGEDAPTRIELTIAQIEQYRTANDYV